MRTYTQALFLRLHAVLFATLAVFTAAQVRAAPEAKLLRVDPRAAQENGNPILTTVIEVAQSKRVSDVTAPCAGQTGNAQLDCMSRELEQPFKLYSPVRFPEKNAIFTVSVEGTDIPAKYISHTLWGESQQQPGVGTAWLILIDADRRMGGSFNDAKQVAQQFVAAAGPNDIINVMFFNDRQVVKDSRWVPAAQKARTQNFINGTTDTFASSGRNRSLLTIIKTAATDGFKALGNAGEEIKVPLHQSMVVLSTGFGGTDPATTGPGAIQLQQYLTQGRFPEDNTAMPKAPVPVISVFFPPKTFDEFRQNSLEFMQNMANPEIGGFFTVVQEGQGGRASAIVGAVRQRFSRMNIVKWRVSCIAPSITQSFRLVFQNTNPPIVGDNTFKDVPVGIDPTTWPLDVNIDYSQEIAKRQGGVHPAGTFTIYGEFCWGGDKQRAEVYFLPAGQPIPTALTGTDIDKAKRTQQQLIAMGMKGTALEASDTFVKFEAPDKDKILHGSGDQAVVRLVMYDNKARRASGVTSDSIIQLKGTTAPLPLLLILGSLFGLVVIALLVVVIVRGGGKKRGGTPAPVVAGGYGAPPPGPAPGQWGAPPQAQPQPHAAPQASQMSSDFMYGSAGAGAPPGYGVQAPAPQAPPPNPYAGSGTSGVLQGPAGVYTVVQGQELRAGRDPAQCTIVLTEQRVSAVHATFKFESGQLMVRDENSNNGTLVNNARLSPGAWTAVPSGSIVRLGPVEFSARVQ